MFDKTIQTHHQEAPSPEAEGAVILEDRQETVEEPEASASSCGIGAGENWQEKALLLQDQFTRLAADFENYRKRVREEQEQIARYGAQKSALELLPVLDNLERATSSLNETSDPKVLYKSFELVNKQLMDGLASLGIQKIQAVGQPFDPLYHEAVNRMPSHEFPENTVMYEAQSGYMLHDKVIRPAQVVVATEAAEEVGTPEVRPESVTETSAAEEEERSNPFRR